MLPVELSGFRAQLQDGEVILSWQTLSETRNAGFEIQHKRKGEGAFKAAAFIDGFGTSTEAQSYEHRIPILEPGRHVFRLKQIDQNGTFHYSPEIEVEIGLPGAYQLLDAAPNPFNTKTTFKLTLQAAQEVTIALYDVLGRRVAQLHDGMLDAERAHTFTIDAALLSSGVYFYRVQGESFAVSRSVVVAK